MAKDNRHKTQPEAKSPEMAAVGLRFRKQRQRRRISLRGLAETMGVSINVIRWHEAGDTMLRADDMIRAAEAMGCTPGFLMRPESEAELVDG